MSFTVAQVNLLDANPEVVTAKRLFEVEFTSATYRIAESEVQVTTTDAKTWDAGFDWIEAIAIEDGDPLEAVPATYRVSSFVSDLVDTALNDRAEWFQRPVTQYLQLYSAGAVVGPPITLHKGRIEDIAFSRTAGAESLTIRAETLLANRNYTPLGSYTDRDQQSRSAGDLGCEYVPDMQSKTIKGWLRA